MPIRRSADPISVQNVWDAVRVANAQKQMADSNRIVKYLQKVLQCAQSQAELYLKQTVQDGLIVAVNKVTTKGSNAGAEVESYKIPQTNKENIVVNNSHDWYCIDCHLAGDVSLCLTCHRVFHLECAHKNQLLLKNFHSYGNTIEPVHKPYISSDSLYNNEDLNTSSETAKISNGSLDLSINNSLDEGTNVTDDEINHSKENNNPNDIHNSSKVRIDERYDETVCSICNMCRTDGKLPINQDELNYLLSFIFQRTKTWVPPDICKVLDPTDIPAEWYNDKERELRSNALFYEQLTLAMVEKKLENKEYRQAYELKVDFLTIQHNIAIYHGTDTEEYKASEFLMKDCTYEISELFNCLNCYKHSNEKPNENWFCIPCPVPHKLVWAKQLGHPYWPAKVMKETDKSCDVRFFGGKYERALLPKMYIKDINTNISMLKIKKKPGFNKALKELLLHQKLLKDASGTMENGKKNLEYEVLENNSKVPNYSHQRKSAPITHIPPKTTQKRSHSLDKLSEKECAETAKRRNSATLNTPIVKVRNSEYATRQSLLNLTNKKKKRSVGVISLPTKDCEKHESAIKDESSTIADTLVEENKPENNTGNEEHHEEVISSLETIKGAEQTFRPEVDNKMPKPERQYCEAVEKTRRKLEDLNEKDDIIKLALECMQGEIDKKNNNHETDLKRVFEAHANQISETKKKQWCYNCEQDAIYHCCWNTAYCSLICQQQHWQSEHKKVCRRKR